jgi:hypothetical protein
MQEALGQVRPLFPSINYLGMRYNLVQGNPQPLGSNVFDPGFAGAKSVVDMSDFSQVRSRAVYEYVPAQAKLKLRPLIPTPACLI